MSEQTKTLSSTYSPIIRKVNVTSIRPNPHQPRKTFPKTEIKELAGTIEEHGLLQPILLRKVTGQSGYELVAGERRLRAVVSLKWKTIPALIIAESKMSNAESAEVALVENIMRSDLNPLEEGQAFRYLLDNGESYRKLAKRLGKDKSYIQNRVRLLDMPDDLKALIREKPNLIMHAYLLNKVRDAKKRAYYINRLINDEGSKYSFSRLDHDLKYANQDERESCDDMYALWDYSYLRDPSDGDERYQGNSDPSIIERCLKCIYVKTPKTQLKQKTLWISFAGSGTGISTAKKFGIGRVIAGDINPISSKIKKMDALDSGIKANSVDCIFSHPPYWNSVEYTKIYSDKPNKDDISLCENLDDFLAAMNRHFLECKRVLKKNGYLFLMIGDVRKGNKLIPLVSHLSLIGDKHLSLQQRVTKIRKRSHRLMPILISNARQRHHLVDITDSILFFKKV